jgi:hypothetical protein
MGTRIRFLGWVPYQGLGTPSFLPPFRHDNLIGHGLRDRDRASLSSSYGAVDRSINLGVPFRKGGGVVLMGRFGLRPQRAETAGSWNAKLTRSWLSRKNLNFLKKSEVDDGISWHVERLRRWLR